MSDFDIDITEAKDFLRNLETNTIPEAMETALLRAAEEAIQIAKQLVPVRTGALQNSIRILQRGPDYVVIGSDLDYAVAVEFGTSKMVARPYIGPAMDAMSTKFSQIFSEELNRRLP
jgi:HK97 gp10 family phage protein